MNIPSQKIIFPRMSLPFRNRVRLSITNGNCAICIIRRYPLTFWKITAMTSSCTQAESKKVSSVAELRDNLNVDMDAW